MKVGGLQFSKAANMRVSKMVKEREPQIRSLLARAMDGDWASGSSNSPWW